MIISSRSATEQIRIDAVIVEEDGSEQTALSKMGPWRTELRRAGSRWATSGEKVGKTKRRGCNDYGSIGRTQSYVDTDALAK